MTRSLMIDGGWSATDVPLRRTRRRSFLDARERPSLEHRVIAVLVARDDDVIENRQTQDFPGPHDVGGRREIFCARGGIATRMIMSEYQGAGAGGQARSEEGPHVDAGDRVLRADSDDVRAGDLM